MSAQDIFLGARVQHVRELKSEVAALKASNASLAAENEALKAHFDLALAAALDLRDLPDGACLEIWDGWNLILGANKSARDREDLFSQAAARAAAPDGPRRIWIVLDGPKPATEVRGAVRISYTGGQGPHRADRLVCDYVRMAARLGWASRLAVRTQDREFRKTLQRLGAAVL